jgi:hypothetical protein
MAAEGHRDMSALSTATSATGKQSRPRSGRLGVVLLYAGLVGTLGWMAFLALAAGRLALTAMGIL